MMSDKTIAYILAEFPSYTETFILREILFMDKFFPIYIIALRKRKRHFDMYQNKIQKANLIYITPFIFLKAFVFHLFYGCREKDCLLKWKTILKDIQKLNMRDSLHQVKLLVISTYIVKIIKQKSISHIHAHFANYPTDVAMLVSELSKIPFSFTAHAHDIYVNPQNHVKKIDLSAFVVTCTRYNKRVLSSMASDSVQKKIYLSYHGVDCTFWKNNSLKKMQNGKQILFIGRLIEKKGIIYLLEAIQQLIKLDPSIQLIIVGKGKNERKLKATCRLLGIQKNVTFKGWQNPQQIKHLYVDSDIFVLPSIIASNGDRDGIPNVLLEAMASGTPVISTPVSGITEVILHEYNGLLVPERDSNRLANAIFALLKNETYGRYLSKNALDVVRQKFDSEKCNQFLRSLFEK